MSEQKSIKYFGAHYCPFSNESSEAYNLINVLFKERYPDVNIELYWSEDINEDNKEEFLNANAQYVPTVTNRNFSHIALKLPKDYDRNDKMDDELSDALLENIYNQLDKEPINDIHDGATIKINKKDDSQKEDFKEVKSKEHFFLKNKNKFLLSIIVIVVLLIFFFVCSKNNKKEKRDT